MDQLGFDLDAFIAGINQDKTQGKNAKDRLNRLLMNTKDHQGMMTFLPVLCKNVNSFYIKLEHVFEFRGVTSFLDNVDSAWYKVMPKQFYGDLSEEQSELYDEVRGYLQWLYDNESCEIDELRRRNYSLLFGVCQTMNNTDNKPIEDYVDCPCLFVYPDLNIINKFCEAINNKIVSMKGRRDWIPMVLSTQPKGRKGVMQVTFTKSAGVGYDCSVNFEFNSEMNTVIDPDYEIPEDVMAKFVDVIPTFLGWNYDRNNKSYFNTIAFKELRDQLKLRVKEETCEYPAGNPKFEPTPENKNDLNLQRDVTSESPQPVKRPF